MSKSIEATINPDGSVQLLEAFSLTKPHRAILTILEEDADTQNHFDETLLLSEPALAEDWNKPEEDEAWKHLQRVRISRNNILHCIKVKQEGDYNICEMP